MNSVHVAKTQEFTKSLFKLPGVIEFARETVNDMTVAIEEPFTEIVGHISDLETYSTTFM